MSSRAKSPVFRASGLIRDQSDELLHSTLKKTLTDHFTAEEKFKIQIEVTILPSCYDLKQRLALVQFQGGIPQCVSGLIANPLGDWQLEMDNTDINFDCHFFGFTQLMRYLTKSQ